MPEDTKPKYSQDELEMMFGDRDYLEYARENQEGSDLVKNEAQDPNPQNHDESPKGTMVETKNGSLWTRDLKQR